VESRKKALSVLRLFHRERGRLAWKQEDAAAAGAAAGEGGIYTGLPVERAHGRVIETEELHMAEENKRKKSWVIP